MVDYTLDETTMGGSREVLLGGGGLEYAFSLPLSG